MKAGRFFGIRWLESPTTDPSASLGLWAKEWRFSASVTIYYICGIIADNKDLYPVVEILVKHDQTAW
jgi:hypothetical protein